MSLLNLFRSRNDKKSASIAKERLQIIVSHERSQRESPDYLPDLQREIMNVITKYVHIQQDQVQVNLQNNGDNAILELNVTLPEQQQKEQVEPN